METNGENLKHQRQTRTTMRQKLYNILYLCSYPVIDFFILVTAILFSYTLYRYLGIGKRVYYDTSEFLFISSIVAAVSVLILAILGSYKEESSVLNVEETKNVIKGVTLSFMLFSVIFVFIKFSPSRYLLVIAYCISLTMLISQRTIFYHVFGNKFAMNGYKKRVLIYGAGDLGRALFRELKNSPKLGILPVGFVDDDHTLRGTECFPSGYNCESGISVLGTGKDIPRLKNEIGFDEVYAAISNVEKEKLQNILEALRAGNIKVSFVPNLYQAFLHKIKINKIGDIPIISEWNNENNFAYLLVKRYMDFILALSLLFLLWPFLIIIGCAIRLDSKGPAIFKQKRIGKDGKTFTLYKYRTMFKETNPYEVNPLDQSDTRITKVGRFLRRMSLDEILQLFNILKGDMAFVGPRPEMPFIVEQYNDLHRERLKVLPGITGLWQLSGDRKKAIHDNMDYDLYYVRNASFFLDLTIMIETMIFAFKGI